MFIIQEMAVPTHEADTICEQSINIAECYLQSGDYGAAFVGYLPVLEAFPHKKPGLYFCLISSATLYVSIVSFV